MFTARRSWLVLLPAREFWIVGHHQKTPSQRLGGSVTPDHKIFTISLTKYGVLNRIDFVSSSVHLSQLITISARYLEFGLTDLDETWYGSLYGIWWTFGGCRWRSSNQIYALKIAGKISWVYIYTCISNNPEYMYMYILNWMMPSTVVVWDDILNRLTLDRYRSKYKVNRFTMKLISKISEFYTHTWCVVQVYGRNPQTL